MNRGCTATLTWVRGKLEMSSCDCLECAYGADRGILWRAILIAAAVVCAVAYGMA